MAGRVRSRPLAFGLRWATSTASMPAPAWGRTIWRNTLGSSRSRTSILCDNSAYTNSFSFSLWLCHLTSRTPLAISTPSRILTAFTERHCSLYPNLQVATVEPDAWVFALDPIPTNCSTSPVCSAYWVITSCSPRQLCYGGYWGKGTYSCHAHRTRCLGLSCSAILAALGLRGMARGSMASCYRFLKAPSQSWPNWEFLGSKHSLYFASTRGCFYGGRPCPHLLAASCIFRRAAPSNWFPFSASSSVAWSANSLLDLAGLRCLAPCAALQSSHPHLSLDAFCSLYLDYRKITVSI